MNHFNPSAQNMPAQSVIVWDLETVPDLAAAQRPTTLWARPT